MRLLFAGFQYEPRAMHKTVGTYVKATHTLRTALCIVSIDCEIVAVSALLLPYRAGLEALLMACEQHGHDQARALWILCVRSPPQHFTVWCRPGLAK